MYEAEVISYWRMDRGCWVIDVGNYLRPGEALVDVTAQDARNIYPVPNAVICKLSIGAETLAEIWAHPSYGAGSVLWYFELEPEPMAAMAAPDMGFISGRVVPMVTVFGRRIPAYTTRLGEWIWNTGVEVIDAAKRFTKRG